MPLVRIELPEGRLAERAGTVGDAVQEALSAALGVPSEERFQVITTHGPTGLSIDPGYLGIARSPEAVIIQVFLNGGRDTGRKQAFYRTLADRLEAAVAIRRDDIVVSLVEVARDDWSFGNGEAQLV